MQELLFKYFPTPRFINPPRIGLAFSDLSIKAVKFGGGASKFPIKNIRIPLESGIIVAGSVVKPEELAKKLAKVREKLGSPYVSFTIPDELTYIFNTNVPVILGHDATESIAFTIEENVPLSLADTIFDFVPLSIKHNGTEHEAKVLVVACVKKEVEKMVDTLRQAELEPMSCLPESQAIANAIISKNAKGTSCIAHIRENRVGIYLVKEGMVHFSTLRSITGGDYSREFLDEYARFLEYWYKYDNAVDHKVETLFVCGDFDYAKQIVVAVTDSNLYKEKAVLSNVWNNIFAIDKHTPQVSYEESLSFAGSIGAATSHM